MQHDILEGIIATSNWEQLRHWFNQEGVVDSRSLLTLQSLVKCQASYSSQCLIVLQHTFNLLATHSKSLTDRSQLLLRSVELLLQLSQQLPLLSALSSSKPYKTLIALMKMSAAVLNETKDAESLLSTHRVTMPEQFFKQVWRYLFIGLTKQQHQSNEFSQDSSSSVSSSSDADSQNEMDTPSTQKVLQKLRSQAMVLLQYMIRQLPITVQANWQMMLKSTSFSQAFYNGALSSVCLADDDLRREFNEFSLLATLLLEPQKKVRLNAISALIILFDVLSVSKWITGPDFEKYEKQILQKNTTAKQSFQPKAYQLYQASKNTHLTLLYLMSSLVSKQPDFQMLSMVFKLYQVVLNSTSIFEKIPYELGVQPLCQLYLLPIYRGAFSWIDVFKYPPEQANYLLNVKICNIQLLGIVVQVGHQQFSKYLGGTNGLHMEAMANIELLSVTKSNQNENLILLLIQEQFALLGKLQQHYQHVLFESMEFWQRFEQIKLSKYLVMWYRVVEQIVRHLPATTTQEDTDHEADEKLPELKKSNSQATNELIQFQVVFFAHIIPAIMRDILEGTDPEIAASALNILTCLPLVFWQENAEMVPWLTSRLDHLYRLIFEEGPLSTSQMRIQFYRCVGILSHHSMIDKNLLLGFFSSVWSRIESRVALNVHVQEKMSWALANICSHQDSLDIADNGVLQSVFQLLMHLANSNKEKLSTNGLRGLGHFMNKVTAEISFKCPWLSISLPSIIQCYEKSLVNKNSKISWNASYSLNNLIQGQNQTLSKYLVSSVQIQKALSQVLQNRGNLKILIHCNELLISAQILIGNEFFLWQAELLRNTLSILYDLQDIQSFLEQRFQARLRWQSFLLCSALLQKLPFDDQILHKQLHDNGTLQRLIEESYELLLEFGKTCEHTEVLFLRGDVPKDELLSKEVNENNPIYSLQKIEEESETASNVKYLRVVSPNQQFVRALEVVQIVCSCVMNFVSHTDEPVSFHLLQALEELASYKIIDNIVIKLQI